LRYNLIESLGSSPGCDHIQIDESKFGKRKHHRGHPVDGNKIIIYIAELVLCTNTLYLYSGVWIFGMCEAILVGFKDEVYLGIVYRKPIFKAGKFFACTVPDRTTATLRPNRNLLSSWFCNPF
jgi:hypothetical protein